MLPNEAFGKGVTKKTEKTTMERGETGKDSGGPKGSPHRIMRRGWRDFCARDKRETR